MASWTAPKYDWVPNDGIANTDLNRAEENSQYLSEIYWASGCIGADVDINSLYIAHVVQTIQIKVAADVALILREALYSIQIPAGGSTCTGMRLTAIISVSPSPPVIYRWISDSYGGHEFPDFTLYSNYTGIEKTVTVIIGFYHQSGGEQNVASFSGWSVKLHSEAAIPTTTTTAEPAP